MDKKHAAAAGIKSGRLAIEGGNPVRTKPIPWEWAGMHYVDNVEMKMVSRVVKARSPFRFYGPDVQHMCDKLEQKFSERLGVRHALAVSSGTAALNVAMAALGVGPGQEIIVPGYMWLSTVACVTSRGAIPVLCEIDNSFSMNPRDLERKNTPRTTAVIMVHMSGGYRQCRGEVCVVARKHNLKVVEDCAQAAGSSYYGRKLGTFGDIGCFSFQYNKAMTTGEGGMVITDNKLLFQRRQAAQDIGHSRNLAGRLKVDSRILLWGLGVRMTELQAAMGLAQLKKLNRITSAMRKAKYRIRSVLADIRAISLRRINDPKGDNGSFLITTYPTPGKAKRMVERLKTLGVQSGPDSLLPCYFKQWSFHLYYNMPALVKKASTSPDGFPWTHPLNKDGIYEYDKGTLPRTDNLFSRSVIQAIPSNSSDKDAAMIVKAYQTAAKEILK